MNFRRSKLPAAMIPGLVFLAIANVGSYLLRRSGNFSESVVDGATGLLMGIAIGGMLLGIWITTRGLKRCGGQHGQAQQG